MKNEEKRQILNLVHPERGSISYEKFTFPDGQLHIKIGEFSRKEEVVVVCRIKCADDLFLLMQVLDVMNMHRVRPFVYISYLMGARMDRVMSFNEPVTASVVINALNRYDAVFQVVVPHCLELVRYNEPKWKQRRYNPGWHFSGVICFPDSSAYQRSHPGITMEGTSAIKCSKIRDVSNGNLSNFQIDEVGSFKEGDEITVLDDLIDGGGTFCAIASLLRDLKPSKLKLSVPHAIQPEGIKKVAELYDEVHISNSFEDWDNEKWELPANVFVTDVMSKVFS